MRFRARDLPVQPEKPQPKEVVQPVVVVQKVDDTSQKDALKVAEAKIMLTLEDVTDKLQAKLDSLPKVKSWHHKIVRGDSGFITEIISTPKTEED